MTCCFICVLCAKASSFLSCLSCFHAISIAYVVLYPDPPPNNPTPLASSPTPIPAPQHPSASTAPRDMAPETFRRSDAGPKGRPRRSLEHHLGLYHPHPRAPDHLDHSPDSDELPPPVHQL